MPVVFTAPTKRPSHVRSRRSKAAQAWSSVTVKRSFTATDLLPVAAVASAGHGQFLSIRAAKQPCAALWAWMVAISGLANSCADLRVGLARKREQGVLQHAVGIEAAQAERPALEHRRRRVGEAGRPAGALADIDGVSRADTGVATSCETWLSRISSSPSAASSSDDPAGKAARGRRRRRAARPARPARRRSC